MSDVGDLLVARYDHPTRAYHDVRHLSEVLAGIDLLRPESADPEVVDLAGWFHDAVYDLRRSDNEAASADLARSLLTPYLEPSVVDEVARLVVLTRDHEVTSGDPNAAVLCDADLAILAGSRDRYDDYAARNRLEYAHLPDETFSAGRSAVLRRLLDRPNLFHTAYGVEHWERAARANLQRELTHLG
ncbi:MAG: hypothetical protein QOI06_1587 [Nocardioidaceae bacterium]|jgi:predicted metal-dependent HD superfamily phosphohydrolase|nr:hypothetical protein [Nocardioidaceae bacterium]